MSFKYYIWFFYPKLPLGSFFQTLYKIRDIFVVTKTLSNINQTFFLIEKDKIVFQITSNQSMKVILDFLLKWKS